MCSDLACALVDNQVLRDYLLVLGHKLPYLARGSDHARQPETSCIPAT